MKREHTVSLLYVLTPIRLRGGFSRFELEGEMDKGSLERGGGEGHRGAPWLKGGTAPFAGVELPGLSLPYRRDCCICFADRGTHHTWHKTGVQ